MASEKKILEQARARMEAARDAERENRELALEDLRFLHGDQWDAQVLQERQKARRPALTFNRLPAFLDQLVGDLRQNKIAIKVLPVDDEADPETAEIFNGLIRNIEAQSSAENAYIAAAESAFACGFGALRILTRYVDHNSFDQELVIEPIKNPFTVYMDPLSTRVDGSDAKWAAISIKMPKNSFETEYPKADAAGWEDPKGDGQSFWGDKDGGIRVMEYYWIEEIPKTIHLLSDGSTVCCKKYEAMREQLEAAGITSVKQRESAKPVVMYAKMTASEILEGPQEWASEYIPIVPVVGKELNVDGKVYRRGVIRNAIPAQKAYNYFRTAQVELLGKQPNVPWIVSAKQIEGHEADWNQSNGNLPYLVYNDTEKDRAPYRADPPQGSPALSQEAAQMSDEMKASTHLYDASMGNRSNETSGIAIKQRQSQGERGNFAFFDNYAQSITQVARILVDMIPRIYDAPRIERIIGPDDDGKLVKLNEPFGLGKVNEQGEELGAVYDLKAGKYDVVATIGPSTSTARQESLELMMDLLEKMPQATPMVADLIVKNMTFKDAEELVERFKSINPYLQQKQAMEAQQQQQMGGAPGVGAPMPPQQMVNPQGPPPGGAPAPMQ
ncbi:MAG: hypothetical protein OEV92_03935 [Nitrospinota bacterium]|nr:hypothetical protein [Nitrospinota bacterium]